MSDPSASKPQLPQVNTQVPQINTQMPQVTQMPQSPQQPQPFQQQQQQQQQQQLAAPQAPYQQQQPYGTAPSSPNNLAPPGSPQPGSPQPGSPQPGYAYPQAMPQPGPPSPQSYYQGYPPAAQQGYQYPPPQQFPPSPQAGYGYPAQPGYPGYAAPQQYAPPQPGYAPHPNPYAPQQYAAPQPGYAPPQSPHYDPSWQQPTYATPTITYPLSNGYLADELAPPHYLAQPDADVIAKALTPGALNRDGEEALVHILPFLAPQQLESIRRHIAHKNNAKVSDLVDRALSSDFQDLVRAVLLGPLGFDVWLLKRAMGGVGYKAVYMDMVLLGRKNGDVKAIEAAYYRAHGKHLVEAIKSEMSGGVEALFRNAIEARRQDEGALVSEAMVEKDVVELYTAMVGNVEGHVVAEILATRSGATIRRITEMYNARYGAGKEKKLEDVIVKKFKGHMEDALLYILQGANNRAMRDARMLENTMKGLGTKTEELTYRIAILHWDRSHLNDVKDAYKALYPKRTDLATRVKGDTSGNHQKLLLALIS